MADYEGSGKIFLDMLVGQLRDRDAKFVKAFEDTHGCITGLHKLVDKNKKKIRGLRWAVFGLGVTVAVLASELAERKRCENWLKDEIDELKERTSVLEGCRAPVDLEEETDGGAADA